MQRESQSDEAERSWRWFFEVKHIHHGLASLVPTRVEKDMQMKLCSRDETLRSERTKGRYHLSHECLQPAKPTPSLHPAVVNPKPTQSQGTVLGGSLSSKYTCFMKSQVAGSKL